MSPRPKTTTDAAILQATLRVVLRLGPSRLTLADVSREAGVAPATLLQRFGSKRGLLLALVAFDSVAAGDQWVPIRAMPSALAGLYAYAECMADLAVTPEVLANNLAFLQLDLTDPEFHKHALAHSRATRAEIKSLLDRAVAAGEIVACDTATVARAVQAIVGGSLLEWAIDRDGGVRHRLRDDVESLLKPYTRENRRQPRRRHASTRSRKPRPT
jgi:AcrR family transcriptional regulator